MKQLNSKNTLNSAKQLLISRVYMPALFCLCCTALLSSVVHAQAEQQIEVISITASKSSQAIEQSPDSISAILASEIALVAPQHINQVLEAAPGTWISRGNGQEHLTAIRSPVLTGAGSCGAFFMGVDSISIRAPGFCNANQLFDVNYEQAASIDVLRSSASTLYGGNALHGVINVISQNAFNANDNTLSLQVGAEDFARISHSYGQQNTGKNSESAWLNLVNLTQENGYQTQSGYDQQKITHIYQRNGKIWQNKSLFDYTNLNQETAGFIRGFESFKNAQTRRSNPNPEAFRDVRAIRAYSAFSRTVNTGKTEADIKITPYFRHNSMRFLQHFLPWQALEENKQSSLGVQTQLSTTVGDIEWLGGVDLDLTKGSLRETQDQEFSPNIPQGLHYDYDVNAYQIATYVQGLWQKGNWRIRAGTRFERNQYDYNNLTDSPSACAESVAVCRFSRPDDQIRSFNAFSPSINVQYMLSSSLSYYIKYAQGFRAPQATELFRLQNNQQISDIDNESMDSIEAGIRYSVKNTSLHLATYNMRKTDVIFQDSERQNVSGAQTKHHGVELEFNHNFNTKWQASGHFSWAQHNYDNDTDLIQGDINGNLIDTAPKWMSNINLNYAPTDTLTTQLSWQYLGDYYLNPQNTAKYDGHQLLDFNLSYEYSNTLKLRINVLNLTNKKYAERADFAFGGYRYFVGQPRRAFIQLVWSY